MAKKIKKGVFITLEGPEGSGKSTQAARLSIDLRKSGYDVLVTSEPGDTALGRKIREILLEKEGISLSRHAELLLFEADRAQHVEEVILPAIKSGKVVICDRYNTATFAYQGYGLGVDKDLIRKVDKAATGGLEPGLTVLLDVAPETGLARAGKVRKADRMEKRAKAFHRRVRDGYLDMAAKSRGRIKKVNVAGLDETYNAVRELVYAFVEGHKRAG
ncbi:MAG: dTMP kinase [Candidatus Omnitrophica bacterium]|nr:dTMP kinase [Candidatus Omnitrophota bacterium]